MIDTKQHEALRQAARLRNVCAIVRSKSYPLSDLIPLMQEAADTLERTGSENAALQQGYDAARLEIESLNERIAMLVRQRDAAQAPPAAVAGQSEREAFEAYLAQCNAPLPMNTRLRDDGRYGDQMVQAQWEAWQARAAAPTTQAAPQQEAQEPVAFIHWPFNGPPRLVWYSQQALNNAILKTHEDGYKPDVKLYTAPQPAPVAQVDARAEQALLKVLAAVQRYLPPDGPSAKDTLSEIIGIVDPWPLGDLKGKA